MKILPNTWEHNLLRLFQDSSDLILAIFLTCKLALRQTFRLRGYKNKIVKDVEEEMKTKSKGS